MTPHDWFGVALVALSATTAVGTAVWTVLVGIAASLRRIAAAAEQLAQYARPSAPL